MMNGRQGDLELFGNSKAKQHKGRLLSMYSVIAGSFFLI